ncbi:MAG: hypothetical protein M3680_19415 [Myxococcota bacterium]|nr:hypothetical protein [Myxococcota bacterium]
MRWIVSALVATMVAAVVVFGIGACGGPKVPQHAGYKSDKAKPWKKPKALSFDDKNEAKAEGELSYAELRRARWFLLDLPATGELAIRLEITPPGEATNEDFDLGLEVLDPGHRVISKSDLEDEDAFELTKTKTLFDLTPGKYLVHLYLQGRMDSAEYVLRVTYKPTPATQVPSSFPAEVDFVPALAMVPLNDDTPKSYKPPTTVVTKVVRTKGDRKPVKVAEAPATTMSARIIGVAIVSGGTQITVGRGTANGAAAGMKGKIQGISSGSFTLASCNERTCLAIVGVTADQIKTAGGTVVLTP